MPTYAETINRMVREGRFYTHGPGEYITCYACGHYCKIREGLNGICKVRYNKGGRLMVPWGYVAGVAVDPIEKKPFFHCWPGSDALSFGMLGCDLHCSYCQNWVTSQALRDKRAVAGYRAVPADEFRRILLETGARVVTSTYNEPLITAEWALELFSVAKEEGVATSFVSNGNATPEIINELAGKVDLYKVDLKSFRDKNYRALGTTLQRVTDSIGLLYEKGFWLEIVTLLVPGFNDDREELREMAAFIAGISPDIPWHITAFHPDYKMTDPRPTTAEDLFVAGEIGREAGLNFVYLGNRPGETGDWENTRCPCCGTTLVRRYGFRILEDRLSGRGTCPECLAEIPGRWT